jgi:hypothetical protein
MKQVVLRITHYNPTGRASHYYTYSYPMYAYQVEEYISSQEPSNPYYKITDIKVIDIDE